MKTLVSLIAFLAIISIGCEEKKSTPGVTTIEATGIAISSALLGGNIFEAGSGAVITYGICWSTDSDPTIANDKTTQDGPWVGTFQHELSPLKGGAIYYARAYATNEAGIAYGDVVEFGTLGGAPTATTFGVEDNLPPKATLVGIFDPKLLPTNAYFEYGPTTSYGQTVDIVVEPNTSYDAFRSTIDGLTPNTEYHFRIVAENEAGVAYGEDYAFISKYELGQRIGLGYIIHIDQSGLHGLIGLETYVVGSNNYMGGWAESLQLTGAAGVIVGTGTSNTTLIIATHGANAHFANLIDKMTFDNHNNWVMASKDELDLVYRQLKLKGLGQYSIGNYMSSSEYSKDSVWYQDFTTGNQFLKHKFTAGAAAAVRSF